LGALLATPLLGGSGGLQVAALLAIGVAALVGFVLLPMVIYQVGPGRAVVFVLLSAVGQSVVTATLRLGSPKLLPQDAARDIQTASNATVAAIGAAVLPDRPIEAAHRSKGADGRSGRPVVFSRVLGAAEPEDPGAAPKGRDPLSGKTVRLTESVTVDIDLDGHSGGQIQLDRGTELKVVDGDANQLKVLYLDSAVFIPRNKVVVLR